MSSPRRIPWKLRCGAKRTNGEPCKKWANYGCTRCRLHGGATPKALAKAPERIQLVARAAVKPAIDVLIECLSVGPRHRRLEVAMAILTSAGILSEENAAMLESVESADPVAEPE